MMPKMNRQVSKSATDKKPIGFPVATPLRDNLEAELEELSKLSKPSSSSQWVEQNFEYIQKLCGDQRFADLELSSRYGVPVRVHKFIVASYSPVLQEKLYAKRRNEDVFDGALSAPVIAHKQTTDLNMLLTERSISRDSHHNSIVVEKSDIFGELSHQLLKVLVKLCYKIAFDFKTLNLTDIIQLLETISKYQMFELKKPIIDYLNNIAVTRDNHSIIENVVHENRDELKCLETNFRNFKTNDKSINISTNYTNGEAMDVLCGENPNAIKKVKYGPIDSRKDCTYHEIGDNLDSDGIKIRLSQAIAANYIRLRLYDKGLRSYSYYIEVSDNDKDWQRVIDYSDYMCRSWQHIYFGERTIEYVRIMGTKCYDVMEWNCFELASIEFLKAGLQQTVINNYLCPDYDMAKSRNGALMIRGVNDSVLNDKSESKDGLTSHKPYSCIIIQLSQIILADSIRLETSSLSNYEFTVSVSVNNKTWKAIKTIDESIARTSDHMIKFESQPVLFIKIYGENIDEDDDSDDTFKIVRLNCPALA